MKPRQLLQLQGKKNSDVIFAKQYVKTSDAVLRAAFCFRHTRLTDQSDCAVQLSSWMKRSGKAVLMTVNLTSRLTTSRKLLPFYRNVLAQPLLFAKSQ